MNNLYDKSQDSINLDRAQSNYSEKRLKNFIVQKRYGETRPQYLWRLLRNCIRITINAVLKSDIEDKVIIHGVTSLRTIRSHSKIKSICYNYNDKKIIILDDENYVNFYKSDGRFISSFLGVDEEQDTSNKFIKYVLPNKDYDNIVYCSVDKQYISWTRGRVEINVFNGNLELLSVAKAFDPIECLAYNNVTGDIITISNTGEVTLWNFRYGGNHLIPRCSYKNLLRPRVKYNLLIVEPSAPPIIRCYASSNNNITVFNVYDGTFISYKDELHIRQITAMLFYSPMKYLVTASKEGSIKVWDEKWFLKMVFVGHHGCVTSLANHPFAPYIISSSHDKTIKLWSLDQQDIVDKLDVEEAITQIITEQDNPKILTCSSDDAQIWRVNHIYEMFTYIGNRLNCIKEIAHKEFPKRILAQNENGGFHIINPASGNVITSMIMNLKTTIVDSIYSSCEDTAIVVLSTGELLKINTKTNPCTKIYSNKNFPKTVKKLVFYEYYSDGVTSKDSQKFDEDEFDYLNKTSNVYRTLRTKSGRDLKDVKLKGFDRTLVFAGCSDGSICTLRWDNLEIDYEIEMHNNREILQLVPNVKEDQLISAGLDLVMKIWRVFPYSADSLQLLRSIFCSYPPSLCCIMREKLCVAFNDLRTLTHTVIFFNRQNNDRYDHRPENDHMDSIVAITYCDRLKIVATASFDETIKIWDDNCQLMRCIRLRDRPTSLAFCSNDGDLLVGIGNHLFKIYHKLYLPKALLFKMISMESEELKNENPIPYSDNVRQLLSPTSFQRLKSAHRNQFHHINELHMAKIFERQKTENEIFDHELKDRKEGIAKLMQRDVELKRLYNGEIKRKEVKIKKKVTAQAFENYMQLYFDIHKFVTIKNPEYFELVETDLFPKPVLREKYEEFNYKEAGAFFPPVSTAKTYKPYDFLYDEYNKKIKDSRIMLGLEVQTVVEKSEPESRVSSSKVETLPKVEEKLELPKISDKYVDEMTQTSEDGSDYYPTSKTSTKDDDNKAKKKKSEQNTEEKVSPKTPKSQSQTKAEAEKNAAKTALKTSSKSKVGEIRQAAISPIFEDQNEEQSEKIDKYMSEDGDQYYPDLKDYLKKPKSPQKVEPKVEIQVKMEMKPQAPYFIPGGFIPNSVLIRILWPDKFVRQQDSKMQELPWKPRELTEEQLQHVKKPKPQVIKEVFEDDFFDKLIEEEKPQKKKSIVKDDDDDDEVETKREPKSRSNTDFMSKLSEITAKQITPPVTPPPPEPEQPKMPSFQKPVSRESDREKEKMEKMKELIKQRSSMKSNPSSGDSQKGDEIEPVSEEPIEPIQKAFLTEPDEITEIPERLATPPPVEEKVDLPKIPTFIVPYQETLWFSKFFGSLPIPELPRTEELFVVAILKKCVELLVLEPDVIIEIQQILDIVSSILKNRLRHFRDRKQIEVIANTIISLANKHSINIRESLERDFLCKCLNMLLEVENVFKITVSEWMYWYLEGNESLRRLIRNLFDRAGLCEQFIYFYEEMDTWETWKIEEANKKKQIKKMCSEFIAKWITSFQMHIKDTYSRMKKGSFMGRISQQSRSILKSSISTNQDQSRSVTVKFDLNQEKSTVQNVSPIDGINYFCEVMHDKKKIKEKPQEVTHEKNTVLVIPNLDMNSVLIRLGESNTDATRPKRTSNDIVLPPIRQSGKNKYGEVSMSTHINLPLKKVQPKPFRHAIETISQTENYDPNEPFDYLTTSYDLLTLKTSNKYFIPQLTYNIQNEN